MANYISVLEGATGAYSESVDRLRSWIDEADAVIVGAGFGLAVAAGLEDTGERFYRIFGDFGELYGINSMYNGSCFHFEDRQEWWAYYSRWAWHNRYAPIPKDTYQKLKALLTGKDYFILTTNIDHAFQREGFPKERLRYTQGDLGLWQCSVPCCQKTYDNYEMLKELRKSEVGTRIPADKIPRCPVCGAEMDFNLYWDDRFVRDAGWHAANQRWKDYLAAHADERVLFLELGVGFNSPGVIKYPFWQEVMKNPNARFATVDRKPCIMNLIQDRSIAIEADIDQCLTDVL